MMTLLLSVSFGRIECGGFLDPRPLILCKLNSRQSKWKNHVWTYDFIGGPDGARRKIANPERPGRIHPREPNNLGETLDGVTGGAEGIGIETPPINIDIDWRKRCA